MNPSPSRGMAASRLCDRILIDYACNREYPLKKMALV
jgi:hypothetical protein